LSLPDAEIKPLVRTEGSGTTYTITSFLATQVPTWRDVVGVDAVVSWPVGQGVRGSSGMAQALRDTPFSLGYLDAVQAQATGLNIAALKNRAGIFVTPSAASVAAAAQSADWHGWQQRKEGERLPLINAAGPASYPVIASVLAVLPADGRSRANQRARSFLQWALQNGQPVAQRLGYVPLPASAAQQVRAALSAKAA
jgi:phosphate transport system substrate-binding protein